MQLVYFSSSEPAPKNAQNRFMHSQKHQGIPLITPLSLRRGVGGEAVRGCVSGCSFPIPSSQVQRGIPLIVLPLPSERAGERLLFPIPSSQTHRGISLIVLPLPSERAGERLLFTPLSLRRGSGRGCIGCVSGCFSLNNQERKRAYRPTLFAHKRKRRPRIAARPPPKSSI